MTVFGNVFDMKRSSTIFLLSLILALSGLRGTAAADFPPITDAERAITAVPGEPNAPAVVLFKKGEFLMAGYGLKTGSLSSSLRVEVRLKILTEEGKSNGEVSITHSDFERLHGFAGRTVLPDGRIIPVSSDAKFVRKTSRSRKTFTTALAFPAVQVGAILDYHYELWFDSIFYLDPWYFSDEYPVRYSEIVFKTPPEVAAAGWSRGPEKVKIQKQTDRNISGYVTKASAENVPSVPDDPYGPPFQDLAAQMLMLPTASGYDKLMESWPKTCELLDRHYEQVRSRDGSVARQARETAGNGSPREKAQALYRFVRDQVETGPYFGVVTSWEGSLGKNLSQHKADRAEKALLLQAMLAAVKIDSRLVWAASRDQGKIDLQLPNPAWFDTMLVLVELEGKRYYLDPSDPALGFGRLRAGYEGTPAVIFDVKKPEAIVLPATPYAQNLRRAELDLALDAKGRVAGTGTLRLTGHQAWEKIDWQDDAAKTAQAWKEWLEKRFREYQISDVKAVEDVEEEKVTVTWALAQRESETLGDEATLVPSAPLGPLAQPFVQPASSRRSAVFFDFPYREEIELRLRWPEGWKVEGMPQQKATASAIGGLTAMVDMTPGERSLVYTRRMDVNRRDLETSQQYESVRSLFGDVEKSDAQKLVLVRR
ncbi:MAG: hypothetical protein DMF53_06220 [Acidobacteria bacterium]|nr:MAG: hypothetical protein DMF53_06220 [Acidobacteriota bacterium]